MFLLDTDIATLAYYNHPAVLARLRAADRAVCLPVVTRLEMVRGRIESIFKAAVAQDLLRAEDALGRTEAFCTGFAIVPIGSAAANLFATLRGLKVVKKLGRGDLLIAAIALAHRATLVTRNTRDFTLIPALAVENWAE